MENLTNEIKNKMRKRNIKTETVGNLLAVFTFTEELIVRKKDNEKVTKEDLQKILKNLGGE